MAGKKGWVQTGFRLDPKLLHRFQSRAATQGMDMGEALRRFMQASLDGRMKIIEAVAIEDPSDPIEQTIDILASGGDAADLLWDTIFLLSRMLGELKGRK